MAKALDLSSEKFGRLTAIRRVESPKKGQAAWLCKCQCGNEIVVIASRLRFGNTKSCGCYQKDVVSSMFKKHGAKGTPEYGIWSLMRDRCNNPRNKSYKYYGGRGIKVCVRWNDFRNFILDMGHRPDEYHSLDRINSDSDYCSENCKWSTKKQQARNRSNTQKLTINGKTKPLAEWAEIYGLPYDVVNKRVWRGWSPEKSLKTKMRK